MLDLKLKGVTLLSSGPGYQYSPIGNMLDLQVTGVLFLLSGPEHKKYTKKKMFDIKSKGVALLLSGLECQSSPMTASSKLQMCPRRHATTKPAALRRMQPTLPTEQFVPFDGNRHARYAQKERGRTLGSAACQSSRSRRALLTAHFTGPFAAGKTQTQ